MRARGSGRGRASFRGGLSGWQKESTATGVFDGRFSRSNARNASILTKADEERTSASGSLAGTATTTTDAARGNGHDILAGDADRSQAGGIDGGKDRGNDGIRNTTAGGKGGPESGDGKLRVKKEEDEDWIMQDSEETDGKININIDQMAYINLISDNEDEVDANGRPQRSLNPIRVVRKQHTERTITFETTAGSHVAEQVHKEGKVKGTSVFEIQVIADDERVRPKKVKGKGKKESKTSGKKSQQEDELDPDRVKQEEDGTLPVHATDSAFRAADSSTRINVDNFDDENPASLLPQRLKSRRKYPQLFSKPLLQTDEDHKEWSRYQTDMKAIAEEFSNDVVEDKATKVPSGTSSKRDKNEAKGRRDDKVYLFQLPPIMPNLCSAVEAETRARREAQADAAIESERQSRQDRSKKTANNPGNTEDTAVKIEDDSKDTLATTITPVQPVLTAGMIPRFKGPVGTLTVYESGATDLDWGGIGFELDRGMGSMLQEALLVDEDQRVASSMSQVVASFVVRPNWDALFGTER